jgi:hypothetical protein
MDQTCTTEVTYRLVPVLNKDLKLERDQHLFSVVSFFGFTKIEESRKVAFIVEWGEVEQKDRQQTMKASYKILHTVVAQFKYFFRCTFYFETLNLCFVRGENPQVRFDLKCAYTS